MAQQLASSVLSRFSILHLWLGAKRAFLRWLWRPRISVSSSAHLRRLGSDYGGWTFCEAEPLKGAQILSCGAGEDISFDIEFARTYSAHVLIVDPTPRAIAHVNLALENIGGAAAAAYVSGGHQPIDAYDLSEITANQIVLIPKAISDKAGPLRFYMPPDRTHVSHSIVNFQNNYSESTDHIIVESVTYSDLLRQSANGFALVKMDIEGAEHGVIQDLLKHQPLPYQILVEFDELQRPSKIGRDRAEKSNSNLVQAGYEAVYFDGFSSFLYVLKDIQVGDQSHG